jgi:hypothetical protein
MFSIHFISQIDHDFASFSKMDLSHKLAIVVRGVICEMLSTNPRPKALRNAGFSLYTGGSEDHYPGWKQNSNRE